VARTRVSGTEGYAEEAESLVAQYERAPFSELHAHILHLIPARPGTILDIGSGTGRDAAAFAAMGHRVVAVEPTAKLRTAAMELHPSPRIEWLDDSLPRLENLTASRELFDVVMLTAVWMHLDRQQRGQAMPRVARLLRSGGAVILSLRHGPVPQGRRMFEVSAAETVELAQAEGLTLAFRCESQDGFFKRPDVTWTRLAFSKLG
jgi:SAM-dependent methyltransferase